MNYSLSTSDIIKKMNGKVRIISYEDLHKYNSIYEILYPYGYVVIIYLTKEHYGHWICVLEDIRGRIEVFDSYGIFKPDHELDLIDPKFKKISYQDQPYLSELLARSGKLIEYNDYQFQSFDDNISTCGRWCILRLIFKSKTIQEFQKIMNFVTDDIISQVI